VNLPPPFLFTATTSITVARPLSNHRLFSVCISRHKNIHALLSTSTTFPKALLISHAASLAAVERQAQEEVERSAAEVRRLEGQRVEEQISFLGARQDLEGELNDLKINRMHAVANRMINRRWVVQFRHRSSPNHKKESAITTTSSTQLPTTITYP
jgi:hypothetical protein